MREQKNASDAIHRIALKEGLTADEVRLHMILAIHEGSHNPDPAIQALWKQIPSKGESPTPEELITYITTQIQKEKKPNNR